jgi:hypothetical protein
MWFPEQEAPSPGLRSALEQLGVSCRQLPSSLATGFSYKAVALLLSSFKEALLLDADNIALTDPGELFGSEVYRWARGQGGERGALQRRPGALRAQEQRAGRPGLLTSRRSRPGPAQRRDMLQMVGHYGRAQT